MGYGLLFIVLIAGVAGVVVPLVRWETTTGVIQKKEIGWRMDRKSVSGGAWNVEIYYEYNVDGKEYLSSRYRDSGPFKTWSKVRAAQLAERYSVGKEVLVYYEEGEPGNALLNPFPSLGWVVVWLMALAGAGGLVAWGRKAAGRGG